MNMVLINMDKETEPTKEDLEFIEGVKKTIERDRNLMVALSKL